MTAPKKHKGARNELIATIWLMDQGYEVFRNISPHGPIDLIARHNNTFLFFDVKAGFYKKFRVLTDTQYNLGVKIIEVEGEECRIAEALAMRETERNCKLCNEPFLSADIRRRYCSKRCRQADAVIKAKEKQMVRCTKEATR